MAKLHFATFALVPGLASTAASAAEATEHSALQRAVLALVAAVCVAALGAIVFSVLRHRSATREAKHFHQRVDVELVWTLIPFAILFALAWPAAQAILH